MLPATRHKWTCPAISPTPANQAGTRFTYPEGMEGWVDLGSLIAARRGIEHTTAWSQVHNALTVMPQSHPVLYCNAGSATTYQFLYNQCICQNYSRSDYSRWGRSPKVNSWELLWQNFYKPDAPHVTQPTASSTAWWSKEESTSPSSADMTRGRPASCQASHVQAPTTN